MGGINAGRWLMGGLIAGILLWVMEGIASTFYLADMQRAMLEHNLSMELGGGSIAISVLVSLIAGLTVVFFYAAARPRFGPGPRTAVTVAAALWAGGYLLSLLGYQMMGLFPPSLLVLWGAVGLLEMVVAGLVGGWLYREA